MKKRGISLIVLIITIIVVIILAAVVILTLSKNNPIESAKEARFKEDVRTFQDELALAVSKEYANAGGHRDEKITTSDFEKIKEYIPSFSEKYKDKFIIEDDELKYTNVADQEKEWCDSLYIKNGLPYTKLEYLESTGEQWINTECVPTNNTGFYIDYEFTEPPIAFSSILGCFISGVPQGSYGISNNISLSKGLTKFYEKSGNFSRRQIDFDTDFRKLYVDGEYICEVENSNFWNGGIGIGLFAARWSNKSYIYYVSAKIYYVKIYENNKIIRDYIPVLDQNNKPALYDKVEGKFYYNQGTGEDFKYKLKE